MSPARFYLECIKRAGRMAFGTAGQISLVLALAGGSAVYLVPAISGVMSILVWAIPSAVFLTVLAIGLVRAPYSIYTETDAERAELQDQLNDRQRRREIAGRLGALLEEGRQIRDSIDQALPLPSLEANTWGAKVEGFLRANLGESYVARFRSNAGLPLMPSPNISAPYRNLWLGISYRMARIDQFIQELP